MQDHLKPKIEEATRRQFPDPRRMACHHVGQGTSIRPALQSDWPRRTDRRPAVPRLRSARRTRRLIARHHRRNADQADDGGMASRARAGRDDRTAQCRYDIPRLDQSVRHMVCRRRQHIMSGEVDTTYFFETEMHETMKRKFFSTNRAKEGVASTADCSTVHCITAMLQ